MLLFKYLSNETYYIDILKKVKAQDFNENHYFNIEVSIFGVNLSRQMCFKYFPYVRYSLRRKTC